ncbi:MAG TPA: KpsF/GutQ family sugar-phosphate isomerase, partial [Chthonomonadales bacterium]|nr:KpsF/GutQ family sugar-phosphate isomerase [Chthonomonadales bacterium]
SIGCPAVFLHPTEAVHGDLGIVDRRDVVLAISNSGESEELTSMLPALTERGVCLISLTGNPASQLGRLATLVLDTSIEREACPLNLAPTTSVVAAIAMGDAVAMALQKRRGLAPEQYALNHPGGRLGKRLTLRVRDIISWKSSPLPVVPPESGLMQILGEITAGFVGATTVCNAQEELLGIITDNDVRRAMQSNGPASFALQASSIMTAAPSVVLSPDQLAYEALQIMEDRERPVSAAPVVEASGRCIAMIHVHDLVRCGL